MEMADDSRVRVMSRSIVKASVTRPPAVVAVTNLDLLYQGIPVSLVCVYRKPSAGGGFRDVVTAFEAKLPSLLDHFFPLAGRIVANPRSGLPELQCGNQGAELVLGEVGAALGSLEYGDLHASLARVGVPVRYAPDVALSVQLLSFACGGFAVAWGSHHVVLDGHALCLLASAWSELARSGTIAAASAPNHDRSVLLRPRAAPAPSYRQQGSSSARGLFTPLVTEHLVNALTAQAAFVGRTYYVEERDLAMLRAQASAGGERGGATRVEAVSAYLWKVFAGVVGASDKNCRMVWWVNGRQRLTAPPGHKAAMRNYVGNVTSFAVADASVDAIQRRPLPEIASMMRESIRSSVTDEHFRELADWVEEHKAAKYVGTATVGLGSPVLAVTSFASFGLDTDFGFGHAALVLPTSVYCGRLCCGFVQIIPRLGGGDGSWIFTMSVWPRLAAALEADEGRIFKPPLQSTSESCRKITIAGSDRIVTL